MTYAQDKAQSVKLLALDVDGVLSDGRVYYSDTGAELKAFNIKDGLGIKLLQGTGIIVAIITGRESSIVSKRAKELGIVDVIQGREDKVVALQELCDRHNLTFGQCAYMGDDLPDLAAINAAGLGLTVADACASVRASAQWCSTYKGGEGAVREACEMILDACGKMADIQLEFS